MKPNAFYRQIVDKGSCDGLFVCCKIVISFYLCVMKSIYFSCVHITEMSRLSITKIV